MNPNTTVDYGRQMVAFEARSVESICAGFREQSTPSAFGRDTVTIEGMPQFGAAKNPCFLAVLEERVVSFLA